jgi:hypothetical protein
VIRAKVFKHIEYCDKLFDGKRLDGSLSLFGPDKEFAYWSMRHLVLELLEELEEKSSNKSAPKLELLGRNLPRWKRRPFPSNSTKPVVVKK